MPAVTPPLVPHALRSRRHAAVAMLTVLVATLATLATSAFAQPAQAAVVSQLSINPLRQTVAPGGVAYVTSRLTADAAHMPGYPIELWKRTSSSSWSYLRTATTNDEGLVRFAVYPTGTTVLQTRFGGDFDYTATQSDPVTLTTANSSFGASVVREASRHAGKPYKWGAVGPDRFDCSGFTLYVFKRFGRSLPHNSGQQRNTVRRIAASSRQPGDLVFSHNSSGSVYHVGIYAGSGYMWHSPRSGSVVNRARIYASRVSYGRVD